MDKNQREKVADTLEIVLPWMRKDLLEFADKFTPLFPTQLTEEEVAEIVHRNKRGIHCGSDGTMFATIVEKDFTRDIYKALIGKCGGRSKEDTGKIIDKIMPCTCIEDYTKRGLTDPTCSNHNYKEDLVYALATPTFSGEKYGKGVMGLCEEQVKATEQKDTAKHCECGQELANHDYKKCHEKLYGKPIPAEKKECVPSENELEEIIKEHVALQYKFEIKGLASSLRTLLLGRVK